MTLRRILLLVALMATLGTATLGPLTASATVARAAGGSTPLAHANPFAGIAVTGATSAAGASTTAATSPGTFAGTMVVRSFAVEDGHLVAHVAVAGQLTTAAGTQSVSNILATAQVAVSGTCQVLDLDIQPIHLNLLGLVVDLSEVHLTITAQQGQLLGNLVCSIANLLNGGASLGAVAGLLNKLIGLISQIVGGLSPSFVAQNGALSMAVSYNGQVVGSAPVQVTATCQVLNLVIGPLHLDLLGLVIDLNQVTLSITAESGAGNLLGNLLCGITNLLNVGNLSGVATLLNQLLSILNL